MFKKLLSQLTRQLDLQPCPVCAELIKERALICRHCGVDLDEIVSQREVLRALGLMERSNAGEQLSQDEEATLMRYMSQGIESLKAGSSENEETLSKADEVAFKHKIQDAYANGQEIVLFRGKPYVVELIVFGLKEAGEWDI